jgi:hypothetical protein
MAIIVLSISLNTTQLFIVKRQAHSMSYGIMHNTQQQKWEPQPKYAWPSHTGHRHAMLKHAFKVIETTLSG